MAVDYKEMDQEQFSAHLKFLAYALAKNGKEEIAALLTEAEARLTRGWGQEGMLDSEEYLRGSRG